MKKQYETFALYDLRVEVIGDQTSFVCSHHVGDGFEVVGENLIFHKKTKFSLYALSALLPLIPAKQRQSHENDWMTTDAEVACPDPNCTARFRITRMGTREFRHSEVTKVPLIKTLKRKKHI